MRPDLLKKGRILINEKSVFVDKNDLSEHLPRASRSIAMKFYLKEFHELIRKEPQLQILYNQIF